MQRSCFDRSYLASLLALSSSKNGILNDVTLTSSLRSVVQVLMAHYVFSSVTLNVKMNYARNYKNLLNFVKVMPKILVVPFFSGHGVHGHSWHDTWPFMTRHIGAIDKTSSSFSAHGKIGNFIIIIIHDMIRGHSWHDTWLFGTPHTVVYPAPTTAAEPAVSYHYASYGRSASSRQHGGSGAK